MGGCRGAHPLRNIRELVREVLSELSHARGPLYASEGRPSIPPEQLLGALLPLFAPRTSRRMSRRTVA